MCVNSMKKGWANFNFKRLSLFVISVFVFTVAVSFVSANSGYVCINCPQNQILKTTEKCKDFNENSNKFEIGDNICLNGKNFQAGRYNWEIKKDGVVVANGNKRVDNTGKFCLETKTKECGEYEINFGGVFKVYSIECGEEPPECTSQTVVGGTIYQGNIINGIEGAEVWVTCNGETKHTTSIENGVYSIYFDCEVCGYGDLVSVSATHDGLTGENSGKIDMNFETSLGTELNVGIVNVPLVPEFGAIVATLTIMGALGVFFVVRKK